MTAILRELARSPRAWFVVLFCPLAAYVQLVTWRPAAVSAFAFAFVAVCTSHMLATLWRRARREARVKATAAATQQLIVDHNAWLQARDERQQARPVDARNSA